jgi:hypothetical protein
MIWCSIKFLMYPESLQSSCGRGSVLLSTSTGVQVAGLESWIPISRVKCWISPTDTATVKPAPEETHYSCEPISDLKLLFKKTPSGK